MTIPSVFDVVIIGGSYAGLSAGMTLGRSLRKVLIIDSGKPCNRQAPHSQNFLTQDGKTPAEIAAIGRQQVAVYADVQFLDDLAVTAQRIQEGFSITTLSGKTVSAGKLIIATGIRDKMPGMEGFAECWGISIVHCPYCHGYEHRGEHTGVIINGEHAMHYLSLIHNLTENITVFTNGKAEFTPGQLSKLQQKKMRIVETGIAGIAHTNGKVSAVLLNDGSQETVDVIYGPVPFEQHSDIPASLGCRLSEHGHIAVDAFYKTTVDGVFACGDSSSGFRSVAHAVASGNIAASVVNKELSEEAF